MDMMDDAAMVEEEYQGKPLDQLKTMFRSAEETHQPARELSRRDVDWYDNFSDSQWSDVITRLQLAGKTAQTAAEFLQGHALPEELI